MKALAGLMVVLSGVIGTPQQPPQFERDLTSVKVTDSLYVLEGAGGNVAVFVWDDGVLLVDDKIAPASAQVQAAVAAIRRSRSVSWSTPTGIRIIVVATWCSRAMARSSLRTRMCAGA